MIRISDFDMNSKKMSSGCKNTEKFGRCHLNINCNDNKLTCQGKSKGPIPNKEKKFFLKNFGFLL